MQGGIFPDLRLASAAFLAELDFPGYAVGGLAVGETKEQMYATLDETCPALPRDKPRYLMGVGAPEDIVEAVYRGRRHVRLRAADAHRPQRRALHAGWPRQPAQRPLRRRPRPVQEDCGCYTCRTFSRAYLRHLYKAGEVTALRLGTIHNVHFMLDLMRQIRAAIEAGTLRRLPRRVPGALPDQQPGRAPRAAPQAQSRHAWRGEGIGTGRRL